MRSSMRTYITKAVTAVHAGGGAEAEQAVREAIRALDKAAERNIIHANHAARSKSRLMKRLNAAKAATS